MNHAELLLHPVRFRLLRALSMQPMTTGELAAQMPDVPKSSIYRHVRLLLGEGMIAIDGTQPVRGVVEKTYRLNQPLRLSEADIAGLSAADHIRYFQNYAMTLIQGFSDYVRNAGDGGSIDMLADHAGYTETYFYASPEEFQKFAEALNASLLPLMQNPPGGDRRRHKIAFITHPHITGEPGS